MQPRIESALAILVPEAETLVKTFRDKYDPSAAKGMPAHISLLYPFKSPDEIDGAVTGVLQSLFAHIPGFTLTFSEARRFPGVLYLAPAPEEPILSLIEAIAREFPEAPPYGGAYSKIIPHLTMVQIADAQQMDIVAAEFDEFARDKLPIQASVAEVALVDNEDGTVWKVRNTFRLADAA